MIDATLFMALDFRGGKDGPCGSFSYQLDGQWYIVDEGAGYRNVFLVLERDEAGLKWLLAKERRD